MSHYKITYETNSDLLSNYPATPASQHGSIELYLEYMYAQGYDLVATVDLSGAQRFYFTVVAK